MTLNNPTNLFPGINPILNSFLQDETGGWESFHSLHVTHLFEALDRQLPPGYFARSEKSLQISEVVTPPAAPKPELTRPDVTVYQRRGASSAGNMAVADAPAWRVPIRSTFPSEEYLSAIVIYQAGEGGALGRPVTRIELLSPANKQPTAHKPKYLEKRWQTLKSGLRLVEIDYLHEMRPVAANTPSYVDHEPGAFPYVVLVSDPRPTLEDGATDIYGFGVDDVMPIIVVPLAGVDSLAFNLGEVYHHTFASSRFFEMIVDYAHEPLHFTRYHEADRERIQQRLALIRTNWTTPN